MAESFVQLPVDSTGKKIRSFEGTVGSNDVHTHGVVLVDSAGNIIGSLAAAPVGTEQAIAVRPIESDVAASGTITTPDIVVAAPDTSGTLLSGASTAGSLVALALPGGDASFTAMVTGLTAGALYFEGSLDSTTGTDGHWAPIAAQRIGLSNRSEVRITSGGLFRGDASSLAWVRVRAVGALTGTPGVSLRVSDATPAILTDGARTVLTGPLGDDIDTIAGGLAVTDRHSDWMMGNPGQRARLTAGAYKEVPFNLTNTNQALTLDVSNYASISVHITAQTAQCNFEQSNDGTNWSFAFLLTEGNSAGGFVSSAGNAVGIYTGPVRSRYFRIRSVLTGTNVGVVGLSTVPKALPATYGNLPVTPGSGQVSIDGQLGSFWAFQACLQLGYNPIALGWDRLRTCTTFKTVTATASGDTALWTPATGHKFRLMRFRIEVTADAATAGGAEIDIVLRDSTTALAAAMSLFVPAAGGTTIGNISTGWIDWANGYVSTTNNNALNVNLSAALSAGKVRVIAAGTEE